ncbi:MAG: PstS family phosphate ABC transporter substrate-binding protein [Bdellovibrionales bacterium]|nr:PstS family phosphate ABC transporter substrate-binding protein [Bdellovibrionales bacterium]
MKLILALFHLLPALSLADVPVIRIDGSSTVFPITEAVSEEFQKAEKGAVRVTVGISGTGGGFKKFCRGETDVQNASRPIVSKEMEDCRASGVQYFEFPVGFDAIAVVVNPKNTLSEISVADLKKIWAPESKGKVMKWNDVRPTWPGEPLKLYGAGADSGTFDYFTEAVNEKAKSSRGDYTASEDDNTLVLGVSNDKNALGYIPLSYYSSNKGKLKLLGVANDGKPAVLPSEKTVISGTYQPLSRPVFLYVSAKAVERPEVRKYVEFYMRKGAGLVKAVGYVPLPDDAYTGNLKAMAGKRLGTVFGGRAAVGATIRDIMKREAAH